MNYEKKIVALRNIQGRSSSTFWGIFIQIPELKSRVAVCGNVIYDREKLKKIVQTNVLQKRLQNLCGINVDSLN